MNQNQMEMGELKPAGVFLLAVLSVIAGLILVFWAVGGFLVTGDPLQKADAIVLLSGGDQSRMDEAVRLFKEGYARALILTETGETIPVTGKDYLDLMRSDLVEQGIPSDSIYQTQRAADSTATEAKRVLALMQERRFNSAIIVTDPYHTRRTAVIYHRAFSGSGVKVIIRPVQGHWYRSISWWLHLNGWKATILELVKLSFYLIGIRPG